MLGDPHVVKFKDVLDHVFFVRGDGAGLFAGFHHQADLLLGDGFLFILRVDVQEAEDAVGAGGNKADKRTADLIKSPDEAHHLQRQLIRILHSPPFGGNLAQHQAEVGEDDV